MWSGTSSSSYSCVQVRIRSPSGIAVGSLRGLAPVAMTVVSASISSKSCAVLPRPVDTITLPGPSRRPSPMTTLTPACSRLRRMSSDCWLARSLSRRFTARRSTETTGATCRPASFGTENRTPSRAMRWIAPIEFAVAMRVFDGTTSVSTAEPPTPDRSTSVTSAPSCTPASAASYPPGPPPTTTMRWLRSNS